MSRPLQPNSVQQKVHSFPFSQVTSVVWSTLTGCFSPTCYVLDSGGQQASRRTHHFKKKVPSFSNQALKNLRNDLGTPLLELTCPSYTQLPTQPFGCTHMLIGVLVLLLAYSEPAREKLASLSSELCFLRGLSPFKVATSHLSISIV